MLLQVDVKLLTKHKIKADDLTILLLLYEKQHTLLNKYLDTFSSTEKEILFNRMERTLLVVNHNIPDEYNLELITIKQEALDIILNNDAFEEFLTVFPASTVRPNGTKDYLKTDIQRCKTVYNRLVKNNVSLHNTIINCLKFELQKRQSSNGMAFMKRLPNWLRSEEWKSYEQEIKDSNMNIIINTSYGTDLE